MEPLETYRMTTTFITGLFGSDSLAHLNVGLALYVGTQFILRTRRASSYALAVVALAEFFNELADRLIYRSWRLDDTAMDILATLFWPIVLYGVSKYRRRRWAIDQIRNDKVQRWMKSHYRLVWQGSGSERKQHLPKLAAATHRVA